MENKGKALFPEDRPEWYVAEGEKWIGPLRAEDVYEKVLKREITLAHYVWRPGQSGWERICDVKTFQVAAPKVPPQSLQKTIEKEISKATVKPAARRAGSPPPFAEDKGPEKSPEKQWFLHYNDSQFGPYSTAEVKGYLQMGRINARVFAWRDGMANWQRIEKIEELVGESAPAKRPPAPRPPTKTEVQLESRGAPRRPLIAKIMVANEDTVVVGVCRDISVGGLQVLTDRIPGKVGARVRLNVSPSGEGAKIEPFVAHGVIVRVFGSDQDKGFSFRFEKLSEAARKAIDAYIKSNR